MFVGTAESRAHEDGDTDDKFVRTFTSEGDFRYTCALHPHMTGIVHMRKQ